MVPSEELGFLFKLLPLIGTLFVIALGVILLNQHFRKNLYQQKLEQEEIKNQHQQELLRSSIAAQELERQRIANDLHDELGAMLSMARMQILQFQKKENNTTNTANLLELIETALASTRRICYQLMPPQIERYGLVASLRSLEANVNSTKETTASLNYPPDFPRFSNAIELGLYRIISELVNNTLKHARASTLTITLTADQEITCRYQDNGIGLAHSPEGSGLGLKSMRARVEALGGSFVISEQETGFNCTIKIPFPKMN